MVASLPLYGYQWQSDSAPAATVGFDDARTLAAQDGVALERDANSESLRAKGRQWELWVADGSLLESLIGIGRELGVRRYALWRLGLEDPSIWGAIVRQ